MSGHTEQRKNVLSLDFKVSTELNPGDVGDLWGSSEHL